MPKCSQPPPEKKEETPPNREMTLSALTLYCTFDPKRTKNGLFMKLADTMVKIVQSDGEDAEELGSVSGCLGGSIVISDEETGEEWRIKPMDLWNAYQASKE